MVGAVAVLAGWCRQALPAAVGTAGALALTFFLSWSDDETGLFMVGMVMVTGGSFAAVLAVGSVVTALRTRWDGRSAGWHRPGLGDWGW